MCVWHTKNGKIDCKQSIANNSSEYKKKQQRTPIENVHNKRLPTKIIELNDTKAKTEFKFYGKKKDREGERESEKQSEIYYNNKSNSANINIITSNNKKVENATSMFRIDCMFVSV